MINIFRQLIVPWLLALLLAWVLVVLWLHNETRSQQQQQIQQLAITVNFAMQANLPVNDTQPLANQLRQIHDSSPLAIEQIVAYNGQRQLIASSTALTEAPVLNETPKAYQVRIMENGRQLALLPVSAGLGNPGETITGQLLPDSGYVAVVFHTEFAWLVWLIPLALLTVAMAVGLALNVSAMRRGQLRQNTDIELLAHNMRRLQACQQQCRISEQLVAPLWPLQLAFNELAASLDQRSQATEQLVEQLNQRLQHLNSQSTELGQQRYRLTAEHQQQQRHIRHWFEQTLILWQRKAQLQPLQLQRLLQMQLFAGHYLFRHSTFNGPAIQLGRWLGQHIDELNTVLPSDSVRLDWHEHPDNLGYSVNLDSQTLKSILEALLMLCLRAEDVTKISVTVQLQVSDEQPGLLLVASCNGNGLPAHCQQLIQTADMLDLQWSDADIALLNAVKLAGAGFSIQSLDGLGCILRLKIPLQIETVSTDKSLQQLLVFDTDVDRLHQRCAALSAVAAQVTTCSQIAELEKILQQNAYQLIVLFAPLPANTPDWQRVFNLARQQQNLICFVPSVQVPGWRDLTAVVQADNQFCLAQLISYAKDIPKNNAIQQILVVDDNETNLAFVQVLLKNKPLNLHTATSAKQVFAICNQQKFDMILLDIQLPDMSGVEIARQLRQLPQYQQVPIIAFTAHATPAEIASYRQAGMDDIILKPLEPARLESLLAKFSLSTA